MIQLEVRGISNEYAATFLDILLPQCLRAGQCNPESVIVLTSVSNVLYCVRNSVKNILGTDYFYGAFYS